MSHLNIRIAVLTLVAVIAAARSVVAAVEGFVETFTGMGEYQTIDGAFDGLDNPGWALGGNEGSEEELTKNGFSFLLDSEARGGLTVLESMGRRMSGQGSYEQEIHISDLDLGEITRNNVISSSGGAGVTHRLVVDDISSAISVSLVDPSQPDDHWMLILDGPNVDRQDMIVPRSRDLVIRTRYDHQLSMVYATYESQLEGDPPVELSASVPVQLSADSLLIFSGGSSGWNKVSGVVTHWAFTPLSGVQGDFNGNEVLDAADIDLLSVKVRNGTNDADFDLNSDSLVDDFDRTTWVHDLKKTYFGDADLNGEFESSDLVRVLGFGEYEDAVIGNSTWLTGDWDGDGDFTSSDLVLALGDGGYEAGPRAAVVPEPSTFWILALACGALISCRKLVRCPFDI